MINLLVNRSCWIFDLDGTLTLPVHDFGFIRHELLDSMTGSHEPGG
jgi:hypothetical protein